MDAQDEDDLFFERCEDFDEFYEPDESSLMQGLEGHELVDSATEFAVHVQGVATPDAAEAVEFVRTLGTVLPDDVAAALEVALSALEVTDNAHWSIRDDEDQRAKRNIFELVVPGKYDLIVTFLNNY